MAPAVSGLAAAVAVVVTLGAFYLALPWIVQPILRALLWLRYDVEVSSVENVPKSGPLLLIPNHLTWIDGFLIPAACTRHGKAMVSADIVNRPVIRSLAIRAGMIPTPFSGPRAIRAAIEGCRAALDRGEAVVMFPEATISRTGLTGPFYRGIEVVLQDRDHVPVVPVALDNLWGSIFSYSGGRFFRKAPRGWRRTVIIVFGRPVPRPITAFSARQALMETLVTARERNSNPPPPPETIDPALPLWEHLELGLITASTADVHVGSIHQIGHKPGSAGLTVPGVALRTVDETGTLLPADVTGELEARMAGKPGWIDTGRRGYLDTDGFVHLENEEQVIQQEVNAKSEIS
jgi:1-acyl-sn-glycerol-3-phosphate acyltransferase